MSEAQTKPPDLITFISHEEHQLLVSLANRGDVLSMVQHLEGLYSAALSNRSMKEDDFVYFQLLSFVHYQFLFAITCKFRCHLSESFASTRVAIDAALIAAQIIAEPALQDAYAKREPPFDMLNRRLQNLVKDGKPLPHALVPLLLKHHSEFSRISSHADIGSFIHRIGEERDGDKRTLLFEYFQFAKTQEARDFETLVVVFNFILVLDVFAPLLVETQKVLPEQWRTELRSLGGRVEQRAGELREAATKELDPEGSPTGAI